MKDKAFDRELDEMVLDRLVDNDLSEREYREVLRIVEEKPDGWRQLAMAFLESQAFENDLSAIREETPTLNPQDLVKDQRPENSVGSSVRNQTLPIKGRSISGILFVSIPVVAACFLILVFVTKYLNDNGINRAKTKNVATLPANGDLPSTGSDDRASLSPDFIRLVGNHAEESLQAPIYDHAKFDPNQAANQLETLSPQIREVLESPDYRTRERTHVMPIRDKTGNQIILPIKEIEIRPSRWEDFQ